MKKINKINFFSAAFVTAVPLLMVSCSDITPAPRVTTTTQTSYQKGTLIRTLPAGYRSEVISGTDYFYHDGAYYQRSGDGYTIVSAPRTSRYFNEYSRYGNDTYHNHTDGTSHRIKELPAGYKTINRGGKPYYRYQNQYYQRQGDQYITVAEPH